jgi:hypothetical protein
MTAAADLASAVDAIVRADPPDLDRVIDRLAGVLAPEELLAACRLLHDRVVSAVPSHLDVVGYLDNVIRWSDAAAARAEPESVQHTTARWEATLARWARYLRTRNRGDLPDLDRLSERSVGAFAPDGDERAAAMLLRALVLAEFGSGGAAVWSALHEAFRGRFRPCDGRVGYARWAGPFATVRFRAALDPGLLPAMRPPPHGGHRQHGQPVIMAAFAAYQRGDRDMSPMRSIAMFLEALQTEQNTPESRANLLGMLAGLYLAAALFGDADGIVEAVELLTEGKRLVGPWSRMSAEFDEFLALAVAIRLMSHGDLDDVAASTDRMGSGNISYRAVNRMTRANLQIHHAVRTGDLSMLDHATAQLQVYVDQRPVGDPDRVTALGVLAEAERARVAISSELRPYQPQELREQFLRETATGATPALRGYALVSAGALLHDSAIAARTCGSSPRRSARWPKRSIHCRPTVPCGHRPTFCSARFGGRAPHCCTTASRRTGRSRASRRRSRTLRVPTISSALLMTEARRALVCAAVDVYRWAPIAAGLCATMYRRAVPTGLPRRHQRAHPAATTADERPRQGHRDTHPPTPDRRARTAAPR